MKKLYGIGTGPGSPKHITLGAVEALEASSVIFAPYNKGKNRALDTCRSFIANKRVVLLEFPMGAVTRQDYITAAETIDAELGDGEVGAFLTIGDGMTYSTLIYTLEELSRDIEVEMITGVPSYLAAFNAVRTPLTIKGDKFLLIDELTEDTNALLDLVDSVAILKTNKNKEALLSLLDAKGFSYTYLSNISDLDQKIYQSREEIVQARDYMSLIIGRKETKCN